MRVLCQPRSSSELAVLVSLLSAEGVELFVHNEHYGAMQVGPTIPLLNERTILVADEDFERARELISMRPETAGAAATGRKRGLLSVLRMVAEV